MLRTRYFVVVFYEITENGGVVESAESSRYIESGENCEFSRINSVHDIISQFEQSSYILAIRSTRHAFNTRIV